MSSATSMKLSAVLCCVAAVLVAGCGGEVLPEQVLAQQISAEQGDPCPTGTCTNPRNGQGIYISEGSSYCIYFAAERNYFCPEHFSNQANGTVVLNGQSVEADRGFSDPPWQHGFAVGGRLKGKPVPVLGIKSDGGELVITVEGEGGVRQKLTGDSVKDLVLEVPLNAPQFQLRIQPAAAEEQLSLYKVQYSLDQTKSWWNYCADGVGTSAFLPESNVHSVSGRVHEENRDTTMACRSGAIATCLVWGYRPWKGQNRSEQDKLAFSYGSCLQAKRAAFFVSSGDYKSYTVSGTSIAVQDKDQILNSLMPGVEAVWTPEGASCLSPQYRRVPPLGSDPLPALPVVPVLPECDVELHKAAQNGSLPGQLDEKGPLATGAHI